MIVGQSDGQESPWTQPQPRPTAAQRPSVTHGFQPHLGHRREPTARRSALALPPKTGPQSEQHIRPQRLNPNQDLPPIRDSPPHHIEMHPTQRTYTARSKDITSQITKMSAKVTLGELLCIAPSVRQGVSSLLDSYNRAPTAALCSFDSAEDVQPLDVQQMSVKNDDKTEGIPGKVDHPVRRMHEISVLKANITPPPESVIIDPDKIFSDSSNYDRKDKMNTEVASNASDIRTIELEDSLVMANLAQLEIEDPQSARLLSDPLDPLCNSCNGGWAIYTPYCICRPMALRQWVPPRNVYNENPAITMLPSTSLPLNVHYYWKSNGPHTFTLELCSCLKPAVATLREIPLPPKPHYKWWGSQEDIRGPYYCDEWPNAQVEFPRWGKAPDSNVSLLENTCH